MEANGRISNSCLIDAVGWDKAPAATVSRVPRQREVCIDFSGLTGALLPL